MFAGGQPGWSSKVRAMQIFHELKQQFPTIPDHLLSACIASYLQTNSCLTTSKLLLLLADKGVSSPLSNPLSGDNQVCLDSVQMGRSVLSTPSSLIDTPPIPLETDSPTHLNTPLPPKDDKFHSRPIQLICNEMNEGLNETKQPELKSEEASISVTPKRPSTLNFRSPLESFENSRKLQLSEKCRDVYKLLNSQNFSEKPPRSPLSAKRFQAKNSPTSAKKETVSTPTQTTDTLVNNCASPSVNLSFNVQMGLVQSPEKPKRTSTVELTPSQPWLSPVPAETPRSFTRVSLTLRPPTSTPQEPIDITSQNSSLTYSTSSFDKEKGLQSRLQITVGPGGGMVSSVRTRPRSSYVPELGDQEVIPARAGSLNNLSSINSEAPLHLKQQARIERMRIELRSEKARLVIMKQEISDLENDCKTSETTVDDELEKQLLMEIKHLTCTCKQLVNQDEEFYDNIYTGPRGPLVAGDLPALNPRIIRRQIRNRVQYNGPQLLAPPEAAEGVKWNCSLCTFLNHPEMVKCEQCEMPRVLHGRSSGASLQTNRANDLLHRSSSASNAIPKNIDVPFASRSISLDCNLFRGEERPNNDIIFRSFGGCLPPSIQTSAGLIKTEQVDQAEAINIMVRPQHVFDNNANKLYCSNTDTLQQTADALNVFSLPNTSKAINNINTISCLTDSNTDISSSNAYKRFTSPAITSKAKQ